MPPPPPPPLDRRDFLKAGAAVGLGSLAAACGLSEPAMIVAGPGEPPSPLPAETPRYLHGVASGDPLPEALILWTRLSDLSRPQTVVWEIAEDEAFSRLAANGVALVSAETDWTVKVDASGLAPATRYWYRFLAGEGGLVVSPLGRGRTAPTAAVESLGFAVVTCSDYSRGLYNAYARVAELDDLQAVVHLGDYIYEGGRTDRVRPHDPPQECLTLADYRRRYASYRESAELQAVHAVHPMIWVWDDHETCDGTWREGADPSNHDEAEDGPFALRKAAALQAALEWLPIRSPDPALPERIYRHFSFGPLCDLAMIDTRRIGRDQPLEPNASAGFTQTGDFADPARQFLGAAQEAWLAQRLAEPGATWRLLGNQVVLSPLKVVGTLRAVGGGGVFANPDQWDGYEPARDRLLDAAAAAGVQNLVVLTGDVHASMAFEVCRDPNNPLVYDGLSGRGVEGIELVTPSISSGGDGEQQPDDAEGWVEYLAAQGSEVLRLSNPHLKLFDASGCGYLLLKLAPTALRAEFWLVPTVLSETSEQTLSYAFDCAAGSNRLVEDLTVRVGLG